MLTTDPALPSYQRPERVAIQKQLDLVADLVAGTPRMHARNSAYIHKWADEDASVFNIRSTMENCFEGLSRTLSAATGMLFAQPPALAWNRGEAAMAPHLQNVDARGTAHHVFLKRFAENSIRDGLCVLLVDHASPPAGVEVVTDQIAAQFNLRPTWAMYERRQVISWREGVVNGRKVLTQIVFHEAAPEEKGAYGTGVANLYRVLRLVPTTEGGHVAVWRLLKLVGDGAKIEEYREIGSGVFRNRAGGIANFLPVCIAYTGRTDAALTASMPLLGVAYANLAHYQQSTDLRFYRALCAFPQRKIIGELAQQGGPEGQVVPTKVPSGPMAVLHLAPGSEASWDELSGSSMEQLERGIAEKLSQMGQMGLAFLVPQTRMAETAEAKRIDSVAQNATLATAGQAIEDAANLALEYHAWYLGIEKQGAPTIAFTKEFERPVMDPQMLLAWATACEKVGIPLEWMLRDMQAKQLIPADADLEQIAEDAAVDLAARRKQKEMEAQARLASAGGATGGEDDEGDAGAAA